MRYTVIYVNYLGSCAAIPLKEVNLCIKLTIKEVFIRGFRPEFRDSEIQSSES